MVIDNKISDLINTGQSESTWEDWWEGTTPESEIRKWDFYGLRPWILKYVPRNGKVVEAGCGLGRWNFYLSELGIDIDGLDLSEEVIDFLDVWQVNNNFSLNFQAADVTRLPYEDNSLGGYISLGVVEHFIEGPQLPIKETFRVLRPGGVAIITTPSISWLLPYLRLKSKLKRFVKEIIGRGGKKPEFFQYEYRPRKLRNFVRDSGLYVTQYSGCDLLYTFYELGGYEGDNLGKQTFAYWFSNRFENSFLRNLGAQSVTISVKLASRMHCFFCGKKQASKESLVKYSVPVCRECNSESNTNLSYYLKNKKASYHHNYIMNPPLKKPQNEFCQFCSNKFETDFLFENYGFSKSVCSSCIKTPSINVELSNKNIQPIWRPRHQK